MKWPFWALMLAVTLAAQPASRPRILGLAHLAVFVSDLPAARTFYRDLLGFEEAFTLPGAANARDVAFFKINDRQWIELINRPTVGEGQLDHVAFSTDDLAGLRSDVASRGIAAPTMIEPGVTGDKSFSVADPDGHRIEFVEYVQDSRAGRDRGKHLSPSRISDRALHAGILVGELARANAFYSGVLGFAEFWRGSAAGSPTLSWVNMRVLDGTDYIEFMLYAEKPAPDRRGSAHHLCLLVPDAAKAAATVQSRAARTGYARPIEIRTGINRKRQINLFDPDGTRVELMEPDTIDGKPAPSSPLPPPR
jgi:lactoylglutathione lyase